MTEHTHRFEEGKIRNLVSDTLNLRYQFNIQMKVLGSWYTSWSSEAGMSEDDSLGVFSIYITHISRHGTREIAKAVWLEKRRAWRA